MPNHTVSDYYVVARSAQSSRAPHSTHEQFLFLYLHEFTIIGHGIRNTIILVVHAME